MDLSNHEELAKLDMEQIEAEFLAQEESENANAQDGEGETADAGEKSDVETASSSDESSETEKEEEQQVVSEDDGEPYIETKNGKGKIPYKVLADLRSEMAELKSQLSKTKPYQAEIPENYDATLSAVSQEMDDLKKKFEDGDIEWEDFTAQQKELFARQSHLERVALKAEIAREMTEQNARQRWESSVDNFTGKPQDGIDYVNDEAMRNDLDLFVKVLGNDPSNADKDFDWFLKTAHVAVMAKNGKAAAHVKGNERQGVVKGQKNEQDAEERAPFNSLSDIPGGAPPAKSELEQLGELSGAAITSRFLKNPAEIDKYLASLA